LAEAIGNADTAAVLAQADAILAAGMSTDSLVSALAEHLRNLLILRTCGPASDLVEAPAVNPDDLRKQAEKFDPLALAQDIPILEELRRQMRQGHGGRALLDATFVRLALAAQFSSIGDLLARVGGTPAAVPSPAATLSPVLGEKKKFNDEPVTAKIETKVFEAKKTEELAVKTERKVVNLSSQPVIPVPPTPGPSLRPTPEMMAELERDPVIEAVMRELDGRIVKVE